MGAPSFSADWLGKADVCPICGEPREVSAERFDAAYDKHRAYGPTPNGFHSGPLDIKKADDYEDAPVCPVCGGEGNHLGTMGNREQFRCRNCGIDFSFQRKDVKKGAGRRWERINGAPALWTDPDDPETRYGVSDQEREAIDEKESVEKGARW